MGLFGGKSILGKITKMGLNLGSIGESLNDITGVSSSARQQYQHQLALQKDAQEFSKWQMQNAHQMEVKDLKEAGLNPVLSAGAGGGASAGVSMGGASAGTSGTDPISMIAGIVNMSNSVRQTEAQVKKIDAEIDNIDANTDLINTETENMGAETQEKKNKEWWANTIWGKYVSPILSDIGRIFGGAGYAAETVNNISSARAESRRRERGTTERTEHYNGKGKHTGTTIRTKK